MSNTKFTSIGAGWTDMSKTGTKFISLKLDKEALVIFAKQEIPVCVFLFPCNKKTPDGPDYYASAPMPESYLPVYKTKTNEK